jgi:hypothetical protein
VHRPLDAAAQARIVSELAANVGPAERGAKVLRPRWGPRAYVAAGSLAMAAAVLLLVTQRRSGEALPGYALDVSGESTMRGPASAAERPAGERCVLRADTRGSFELLARPDEAAAGDVLARAYLVRGGSAEPWKDDLDVSPKGSVRIVEPASSLLGASELRIVIGRPEHLGASDALAKARGEETAGSGWQVLRCAIEERGE